MLRVAWAFVLGFCEGIWRMFHPPPCIVCRRPAVCMFRGTHWVCEQHYKSMSTG